MALPDPKPGLVIRYAFLWREEAAKGREESSKDRPCAVVLTTRKDGDRTQIVVAPITHTDPGQGAPAIEIPTATKQRLGLDDERSWIITNEINVFEWPGPDIRPIPGQGRSEDQRFAYGYLGPKTLKAMIDGILAQRQRGALSRVNRDDPAPPLPRTSRDRPERRGPGRGRSLDDGDKGR